MTNLDYLENEDLTIEEQIELIGEEDRDRILEKISTPNQHLRNKVRRKKEKDLYRRSSNGPYTGSGIYYKTNIETGDRFLSRYYSRYKKRDKEVTNKKVRANKLTKYSRGGYRKTL